MNNTDKSIKVSFEVRQRMRRLKKQLKWPIKYIVEEAIALLEKKIRNEHV